MTVEVLRLPAPNNSSAEGQQLAAVVAAYEALQQLLQTCRAVESICKVAADVAAELIAAGTFEGDASGGAAAAAASGSSSSNISSRGSFSLRRMCSAAMNAAVNMAAGSNLETDSSSNAAPDSNCSLTFDEALIAVSLAKNKQQIFTALSAYEDLQHLPGQLLAVADELAAALPVRCCCNNPGCANLAGPSEQQLVGGRGCVCARCRTAR
jgi:hypothetical protein